MDDIINEMIQKGLLDINRDGVLEAHQQYILLTHLKYTKPFVEPDEYTLWLRMYREN